MQNGHADNGGVLGDIAAEMRLDVLTSTQDVDNEKMRHQISRSFICMYYQVKKKVKHFANMSKHKSADTITGKARN